MKLKGSRVGWFKRSRRLCRQVESKTRDAWSGFRARLPAVSVATFVILAVGTAIYLFPTRFPEILQAVGGIAAAVAAFLAWRTSERAVKVQEDLLQHERRKYLLTVKPEWDLWWSVEFDPDRSMSTLQTNFKFHGPEPASTFKAEWRGRLTWNEFSSAFPEDGQWKLDPPEDSLEVGATRQLDVGAIFKYMAEYDPPLLPVSEPLVSLGLIVYLTVQMVSGGDKFSCQQYLVAFRTESGWLFGETDRLRYRSALSAKSKAEFESLTWSSTDGQYREEDSPYGEEFTLDSHNENRPAE